MEINILDVQRHWPILGYLPHSLLKNVRLVYVFGVIGCDVLLVTNDHKVFFYGSNENFTDCESPLSEWIEVEELSQKHIKGFACNSKYCSEDTDVFVVSYLTSGEVYLWGYCVFDPEGFTTPYLVKELPKTVVKVACGCRHFLALTSDGMVYAWGDNSCGQIASELGVPVFDARKISFPFDDDVAADIACGYDFSVVVTGKRKMIMKTFLSPDLKKVSKKHQYEYYVDLLINLQISPISILPRGITLVVVFGWGKNSNGQLGGNKEHACMPVIRELPAFKNISIQQIVCGNSHILALDGSGALFSCGSNSHGQLGLKSSFRFKEIAASGDSSVGETLRGEILVCGSILGSYVYEPTKTACRCINEAFALYRLGGMHKQIEVTLGSENVVETVAESVRKSFGNPELSDFKIIVQEKEILVHKYILALRSKYFGRMFANNWSEGKMSCIKMDESYESMSAFLKYLYTDEINDVDLKVLLDVAIIAEKYCELNLVNLCLKTFESGLDQSNVAELYELTLDPRLSNFNDLCMNYASHCLSAVTASRGFNDWNPETYKNFFQHEKIKSLFATCN